MLGKRTASTGNQDRNTSFDNSAQLFAHVREQRPFVLFLVNRPKPIT
jgi:hypothetical protein